MKLITWIALIAFFVLYGKWLIESIRDLIVKIKAKIENRKQNNNQINENE